MLQRHYASRAFNAVWFLSELMKEKQHRQGYHLQFENGEINFYACSLKIFNEDPDAIYDWSADVMNDAWSAAKAKKKLKEIPDTLVADALLNQNIFAGVGNIIKNEVLWRIKLHPKTKVGDIPPKKNK